MAGVIDDDELSFRPRPFERPGVARGAAKSKRPWTRTLAADLPEDAVAVPDVEQPVLEGLHQRPSCPRTFATSRLKAPSTCSPSATFATAPAGLIRLSTDSDGIGGVPAVVLV